MNESGHNGKIRKKNLMKRIIVINTVKEAAITRIKSKRHWEGRGYRAEKDSTVVRVEGRNVLSSQLTP